MKVEPFVSIDEFVFGSKRKEVRKLLRSPYNEQTIDFGGVLKAFVDYYPDIEIKLSYNALEELDFIEFFQLNEPCFFHGKDIKQLSYDQLINWLKKQDNSIEFDNDCFIAHQLGIGGGVNKTPISRVFFFSRNHYQKLTEEDKEKAM